MFITDTNYAGMLSLGVVYLRLRNAVKSRDHIFAIMNLDTKFFLLFSYFPQQYLLLTLQRLILLCCFIWF